MVLLFSLSVVSQNDTREGKFVFLFIGDGMGLAQVNAAQLYLSAVNESQGVTTLSFTGFPYTALATNHAMDRIITGSAASGTTLASGQRTAIGRIGVSADGLTELVPLTVHAREAGMKTGVITTVSLDHATPASFYAHAQSRKDYFQIGLDLVNSEIDFFGGGGLLEPVGTVQGVETDLWELAEENGFYHAGTPAKIDALGEAQGKVILTAPRLTGGMAMPYHIDNAPDDITLAEITRIAVDRLGGETGFFILVEGGKIDWACHDNDAATAVHEVIAFSEAVRVAVDHYNEYPENTTIIVTSDHETGGMSIGSDETGYEFYPAMLKYQKISFERLDQIIRNLSKRADISPADPEEFFRFLASDFGLGNDEKIPLKSQEKAELTELFRSSAETGDSGALVRKVMELMSKNAGIGWASGYHTGINVPVFSIGRGAEKFTGIIDQTELSLMIRQLME